MIREILILTGASLVLCCLVMTAVWIWAVKIKNGGVVDVFWSYNFPLIAGLIWLLQGDNHPRVMLLCGLVILWGLRLGTHLANRVLSHLHDEEGRYAQLRQDWGAQADWKLFRFFQFQAVSNVLLSLPFFIVAISREAGLSAFEYAGTFLWLLAISGEALSDLQLHRFKNNPAHKGKVCDAGLWRYSRHPNYFFEWLIWVAFFVFALGSPFGFLAILSPAIMLYLLLNVTGIPATEEQAIRSKGDLYRNYQRRTSAFVPWFRRR